MPENYSPKLLDHYHHPRNIGTIKNPTHKSGEANPACGDEITVYLKVVGGKIEDIKYEARGCALVVAGASAVSEEIKGQKMGVMGKMGKEKVEKLLGVKVSPARESCIILALNTIKKVLYE